MLSALKGIVVKPYFIAACIILCLCLALGRGPGMKTAGTAVAQFGYSVGAAIGFTPVFFSNANKGREAASKQNAPSSSATPG
jgi:hypothetical protein